MFTVIAGKYDGYEHNVKYVEVFSTLDEALVQYYKVCDYPWAEIEYFDGTNTHVIQPYKKEEDNV